MKDQTWQSVRYLLIVLGTYLLTTGKLPAGLDIEFLSDAIIQAAGGLIDVGSIAWGLYVRHNTKSVPASVAARPEIPTVSTATGLVEK